MCPYCKHDSFRNSWGRGNAICMDCEKEFVVTFNDDGIISLKLEEVSSSLTFPGLNHLAEEVFAFSEFKGWPETKINLID